MYICIFVFIYIYIYTYSHVHLLTETDPTVQARVHVCMCTYIPCSSTHYVYFVCPHIIIPGDLIRQNSDSPSTCSFQNTWPRPAAWYNIIASETFIYIIYVHTHAHTQFCVHMRQIKKLHCRNIGLFCGRIGIFRGNAHLFFLQIQGEQV